MIGNTVRHPNYDGATIVAEYKSSGGDECYVLDWKGQRVRVTADSCRATLPQPMGRPPGNKVVFGSMRPAPAIRRAKPNGKCGAHSQHPVSLYELAKQSGVTREAVGQYVRRHGYAAAVARYARPEARQPSAISTGGQVA